MDPVVRLASEVPDLSLPDLGGVDHRFAEQRGWILVVDFWSAECPWSNRADESIAALVPGWSDRVVVWRIACNANETVEQARAVASTRGLDVILRDADGVVADAFGAVTTPHLFAIDQAGVLRYGGGLDDVTFRQRQPTRHYLAEAVQALLNGRLPDPAQTQAYGCTIVRA